MWIVIDGFKNLPPPCSAFPLVLNISRPPLLTVRRNETSSCSPAPVSSLSAILVYRMPSEKGKDLKINIMSKQLRRREVVLESNQKTLRNAIVSSSSSDLKLVAGPSNVRTCAQPSD